MKLAYFSPLRPQQSGISDYSEELLPHLAMGAEIDLFVDGFKPLSKSLRGAYRWFDYQNTPAVWQRLRDYDAILYHMGDEHRYHAGIYQTARAFPGIVLLHDYALHTFFRGLANASRNMRLYHDEFAACGDVALPPAAALPPPLDALSATQPAALRYPLNCRIARNAEALIVHSEWSRARLSLIAPAVPIAHINHHVLPAADLKAGALRHKHRGRGLELASFGQLTAEKSVEPTLRVLAALREHYQFHYTLVGPHDGFDVWALVRGLNLTDRVTVTGYVPMAEFKRRIAATDVAIALRNHADGDASSSVCRLMAAGVPCIVANAGWFAELPAGVTASIEPGEQAEAALYEQLRSLLDDAALRQRIGAHAQRYMRQEHTIEQSAKGVLDFIRDVIAQRERRRFMRRVSTELAHLDPEQTNDIFLRGVAAEIAQLTPAKIFAPQDMR